MLPPSATCSVNALNSELSWKKNIPENLFKGGVVDPISFSSGRTHTCILLTGAIKLTKIPFGVAEFFGADNQKPLHDI